MLKNKIFDSDEKKGIEKVKIAFAIFTIDEGKIFPIIVTDGLCSLFKKDRESLVNYLSTSIGLQIYPDDRPLINETFNKSVMNPEIPISIEYRFHTGDNNYFWIQTDVSTEKREDGSYLYYVYYKDNSEAHNMEPTTELIEKFQIPKKSKEALYISDYNSDLEIINQAMLQARFFYWIYDVKTKLITSSNFFNGFFQKDSLIKGYPQFLFTLKIMHLDEKDKYYSTFFKAIEEGEIIQDNFKTLNLVTKDYSLMHYIFTPIKNKEGKVISLIGTAEQYSSRNKMFSIIRTLLNQNELITWNYFLENSKLNFVKSDIETNNGMDRILVQKALLNGKIEIPKELIEGKKKQTYKIVTLKSDIGSDYQFEITHTLIEEKGMNTAILGMARDVTKYYTREKNYIKELEKANTNKTAFLGRLSHDMRTPLGAISSLSNFGLDEIEDRKAHLYFTKIKDNSEYLLSFISDVLESKKICEGKLSYQPEVFRPKVLFEQIISVIQLRAIEKNINLEINNSDTFINYNLFNDVIKIKKLAINLINNAIKYTPKGGTIKIKSQSRKIDNKSIKVTCSISDNGVGMSKEFQKHMYDEFSQEHNILSFEEEGTGLGLSIVKRIIELLNGTITCESELNKGTKFTISFNCKFATENQLNEYRESLNENSFIALNQKKVLICEDKEINILIESKLLRDKGIIIDVAQNGLIGVDKVKKNEYDAILMDVRMPKMDGLTATKEIRKFNMQVPIIALSANAAQEDVIKSLAVGMNDHISKPIDKKELYKVLLKHLS